NEPSLLSAFRFTTTNGAANPSTSKSFASSEVSHTWPYRSSSAARSAAWQLISATSARLASSVGSIIFNLLHHLRYLLLVARYDGDSDFHQIIQVRPTATPNGFDHRLIRFPFLVIRSCVLSQNRIKYGLCTPGRS